MSYTVYTLLLKTENWRLKRLLLHVQPLLWRIHARRKRWRKDSSTMTSRSTPISTSSVTRRGFHIFVHVRRRWSGAPPKWRASDHRRRRYPLQHHECPAVMRNGRRWCRAPHNSSSSSSNRITAARNKVVGNQQHRGWCAVAYSSQWC